MELIANTILYLLSLLLQPTEARCPDGFDLLGGVRRSGHFVCAPEAPDELRPRPPGPYLHGRIFCSPHELPVQYRYGNGVICKTLQGLFIQ